ncbi:MAG TPA: hypothetical protein VLD39_04100, partial [Gammaproteobacteria bacterium]|nr:hypothetical protein [Gammaproteobacteria bacterium]
MTAFDLPSMRSRELDVVVLVLLEGALLGDDELEDELPGLSSLARFGLSSEAVELEELEEDEELDELEPPADPDELEE